MFKKIFIAILAFSLFAFPRVAAAKVMLQEKGDVIIGKTETIDDDLFIGAESTQIDGNVLGSVFVGTGKYVQSGNIKGDLFVGTGKAVISGNIGGDIFVGSGDVELIKATVGGNIIAGSGTLTIDKDSKIGGTLIAATGNLKNSAPIGRNIMAGAGMVTLDSKVGKEVRVGGGQLTLGPSTNIAGDLTYALGDENTTISQDSNAKIGGKTTRYTPPAKAKADMAKARADMGRFAKVGHSGFLVVSFLGSLLLGFILLKLFPKTSLGLATQVKDKLLNTLGIGFLIVIFAVPVLLVLALTVIGLPLAGVTLLVFMLALHFAKLISAYALGRFIAYQFSWKQIGVYAVSFIGLTVFYFLRAIPVVGFIASTLFTWAGLGAIWLHLRANLKNL